MGSKEPLLDDTQARMSPGAMLQAARQASGMTPEEVASRLNWLREYVAYIERDEFSSLRRPAFARGYVRAYGRLMQLDEELLLSAFDAVQPPLERPRPGSTTRRPQQLQRTGLGIVLGLAVLALLVLSLWWFQASVTVGGS